MEVLLALAVVTVPSALLVGVASARLGRRRGGPGSQARWLAPAAGFLLLGLVSVDLVPDAVEENADLGSSLLWVLVPVALTLAGASLILWRPSPGGCCPPAAGMLTAVVLAAHGLLEGFVVGLGVGVGLAAGLGLLALFAAHRFAEGFALAAALAPAPRLTRALLVALAAVTPLVGGDAGLLATPGPRLSVVITAALAGLLGAVGLRLLGGASDQAAARSETAAPPSRAVDVDATRIAS